MKVLKELHKDQNAGQTYAIQAEKQAVQLIALRTERAKGKKTGDCSSRGWKNSDIYR